MRTILLPLFLCLHLCPTLSQTEEATAAIHRFEPVDASRERTVPVKVYLPVATTAQVTQAVCGLLSDGANRLAA